MVATPASSPVTQPEWIDFHFDLMCPYAYQTSLWMREVRDLTGLAVKVGGEEFGPPSIP